MLIPLIAFLPSHRSLAAPRRLSDGIDVRPFQPRAPVLLASGARRSSPTSLIAHATLIFPSSRPTFRASLPPSASHRKSGTTSQALSRDTSSARGSSYHPSIATLPSAAYSTRLTSTFARTRTTGIGRSTSSTESRATHSSRDGSKSSGCTGRMTMVMCLISCLVGIITGPFRATYLICLT